MLIDAAHADTVHTFIREGTRKGTLLLDGREQSWPSAVGPTIFVDIDPPSAVPGRDFRAGAGRHPF
jgi:gamma-glutamyl-gamma-aminobutyraldehyde dehydrogenase